MGKGPEPVPIRIIAMGRLRFAHPTGLVDLGEGATGAGRRADREVYLRVRELVARASDY